MIRGFDWFTAFVWVLLIGCISFVCIGVYVLIQEDHACVAKGGHMKGNGDHYTTVTYVSGVPIISQYEGTECTK